MKPMLRAKRRLGTWMRDRLRQSGYALERLPENAPPGLQATLRHLLATLPRDGAVVYDGFNRGILELLRHARVEWTAAPASGQAIRLALLDFNPGHPHAWTSLVPALSGHGRVLLRIPLGAAAGLAALEAEWEQSGLHIVEVPDFPRAGHPVETIERIAVLLAPFATPAPSGSAAARIDALRTWVGGPLGGWVRPRRLAGPVAGPSWDAVLNPGALAMPEGTLLLCRSEAATWEEMKADEAVFMRRCRPRLFELDASETVPPPREVTWTAAPPANTHRLEDFRLFTHAGRIVSNHAILRLPAPARATQPVDLDRIETRVGFSALDPERAELRFLGEPKLPRDLGRTEKNWACFSNGAELFLLYSAAPYRLYRCNDWDRLEFTAHVEADWRLPGSSPDLPPLRNSINPVLYDENHWLHIVHRVYPGKRYAYWPVLISRATLRPIRACVQPLACGGWTGGDGLLYLSAAVARPDAIDLYFGMEDCATGHTRLSRRTLDAAWRTL